MGPRKAPNCSYRLLRAIYPALLATLPNQVIAADNLAGAMVDAAIREPREREALVFENREIRAIAKS